MAGSRCRRFAGRDGVRRRLVCSEMVPAAGSTRQRATSDTCASRRTSTRWRSIFGSDPGPMAEAARMVATPGPTSSTSTSAAPCARSRRPVPARARSRTTSSPAPGLRGRGCRGRAGDGEDAARCPTARAQRSRSAPSSRPGVASLTLHPRSAQQMYTGTADHTLTAELVDLVGSRWSPRATSAPATRPSA